MKLFSTFIKNRHKYRVSDLYIISMAGILAIINLLGFYWLDNFFRNFTINFHVIIFSIILINTNKKWNETPGEATEIPKWLKTTLLIARNFYLGFAILIVYSQFQVLIKAIHPIDYDLLLKDWDLAILGMHAGDLTKSITYPIVTEFLQISYSMFYFLPAIAGLEIYKMHDEKFDLFARNIIFTFFLSYLLYFFLPAIGPRFAVYDFFSINSDLPGIFLTNILREAINFGGGVIDKSVDPALIVNRDCMPSGHTMITLVNIILAFRFKVKSRYFILIFGIGIIIATVYMRYHYFVDILAGILFAFIALWLEPIFNRYFRKFFINN